MHLPLYLTNADAYPQFIVSNLDKQPRSPSGIVASHKNPANWMRLTQAIDKASELGPDYRVGFSITRESGFFFLDIDKALQDDNTWPEWVNKMCAMFPGCFIEISQSGRGLHVIGRYSGEIPEHKNKNTAKRIELYTHDRFVLFGSTNATGDWNTDATDSLKSLIMSDFKMDGVSENINQSSCPADSVDEKTDEEVIASARTKPRASNAFGNGASFSDLYDCNVEVLSRAYRTSTEGKAYDASSADLALANMLAYERIEAEQIVRIMWTSGLARDKWYRDTYLLETVLKAISSRNALHLPKRQCNDTRNESQEVLAGTLNDQMPQEFAGCYFVKSEREIYTASHGLVNQEGFNVCFYGPQCIDPPYKTFKKHAATSGRIIDHLGFRPDLPHGAITEREGETFVNTYKPLTIKMKQGDSTPFKRLLAANYPDPRDQRIIMSFAATMIQKPGTKAQYALVLQGVQGCGKSLLVEIIANAVGLRYTHKAKADEFENRFNAQWFGKTFIAIEDPEMKEAKLEEVLKPLITQDRLSFEGKGKNARMGDFPANFILTLNNFDNLQKRKDARRLAVFMSALQTPEDLHKAGLTEEFFSSSVKWLRNGGHEICTYELYNYQVDPEFDFSGLCVRAPQTSTTDAAIEASRDEIHLILLEEIELGRAGFKNGWISSIALTLLLNERRIRYLMPDNKRARILKELGYVLHPALKDGRTSRNVEPDNKRPALFIRIDHPSFHYTDKEEIQKSYEMGQKYD